MPYYEQIRAEVVKCCPEVSEYNENNCVCGHGVFNHTWHLNHGSPKPVYDTCFHCVCKKFAPVLGSPIELHHILRTIENNDCVVNWKLETNTHLGGLTVITFDGSYETEHKIDYNFSLPLALQSEETLKGLSELLSGNNK